MHVDSFLLSLLITATILICNAVRVKRLGGTSRDRSHDKRQARAAGWLQLSILRSGGTISCNRCHKGCLTTQYVTSARLQKVTEGKKEEKEEEGRESAKRDNYM